MPSLACVYSSSSINQTLQMRLCNFSRSFLSFNFAISTTVVSTGKAQVPAPGARSSIMMSETLTPSFEDLPKSDVCSRDDFLYSAEDTHRTDYLLDYYYEKSFCLDVLANPTGERNDMPVLTIYDDIPWWHSKYHERLWLLRTDREQSMRSKEADTAPAGEPQPKKRKIRAAKEKSVGDLLGQMGS